MKKILLLLILCLPFLAFSQSKVHSEIQEDILSGKNFQTFNLFETVSTDLTTNSIDRAVLDKGVLADLNMIDMRALWANKPLFITMNIPSEAGNVTVLLKRHNIFTEDFKLRESKTGKAVNYTPGLHYKGIVEGEKSSIAAFSFYPTEVMGLVSNDLGNLVIAKQENRAFTHLIYNDFDLKVPNPAECGTADDGYVYTQKEINFTNNSKTVGDCIRLYIEIDDDIVTQKGGGVAATNYVTGLFNQSIILYANDQIDMTINEIFAWTTPAPYSGSSSSAMLSSFQSNTGAFNGDLAHLVSYQASGGIAAGFAGICASNVDNSKCFSSIDATYANVPTYSWSVMVVTHEMGHLIGSRHTHACVWNGNGTAIDGCSGSTEGSCSLPGNPGGGGTIMSYCHLQSVGINLSLGFGPQPGAVVRGTVANASCLSPCGPGCNDGIQNGDETGVDCGGSSCPACPTCNDGIQNGDESGIDCGGSTCPPCPAVYCGSSGSNTTYEWIQSISVANLSNNSGNNGGYGNYTNLTANVDAGTSYNVSLTPGFASTTYAEYWSIWVDLNGDVDFDDAGELLFQGNGTGVVSGNLTIPSSAIQGNTRMRISMLWNAYSTPCQNFTYGEVEDYTINIASGGGPTCTDGIQNGDETGVDCGGSTCPACPTCNDGIQNGDETGVDCGGSTCPACPTCFDGIQNGDEEGVDCGGANCAPCNTGGCTNTTVSNDNFEGGWGIWNDGGSDCSRILSSTYANSGSYSIRLRDNTSSSVMTTNSLNLANAEEVTIDFSYITNSMDNSNEDFWLQASTNGGASYSTLITWSLNSDFQNNIREFQTVIITGTFTSNTRFRFRCDASANDDQVFIDDVVITACTNGSLQEGGDSSLDEIADKPISAISTTNNEVGLSNLILYPVPTSNELNVSFDNLKESTTKVSIVDMYGRVIFNNTINPIQGKHVEKINTENLGDGIYFITLSQDNQQLTKRFVIMNK